MAHKTKNTSETEKIDIGPDVMEPVVSETPRVQNETAPQNPVSPKTAAGTEDAHAPEKAHPYQAQSEKEAVGGGAMHQPADKTVHLREGSRMAAFLSIRLLRRYQQSV